MQIAANVGGGRAILTRSPLARLPDRVLRVSLTALAALILALIVYFFVRLVGEAQPAFAHAGANSNALADETLIDPLSGNAVLNGIPIELAAAE